MSQKDEYVNEETKKFFKKRKKYRIYRHKHEKGELIEKMSGSEPKKIKGFQTHSVRANH